MVHHIANGAIFLKYGTVKFIYGDDSALLFIMLVSENHVLTRREKEEQQPGINDYSFCFSQLTAMGLFYKVNI